MNDEFNMSKEIERGLISLKFNQNVLEFCACIDKISENIEKMANEQLKILISYFKQGSLIINDMLKENNKNE